MIKKIFASSLLVALFGIATSAQAVPITGQVFTEGRYRTNSGDLANATSLWVSLAWTTGGTGSYAAAASATYEVVYSEFTFNPALLGPVDPLWHFSDGTRTYSFVMYSVDILAQAWDTLELYGTGMLYITGYDPTPGSWQFSTTCKNIACTGRFIFTTGATNVPEPGSLALLGLGLIGLSLVRRRRN